jgi:hypothetical protein
MRTQWSEGTMRRFVRILLAGSLMLGCGSALPGRADSEGDCAAEALKRTGGSAGV